MPHRRGAHAAVAAAAACCVPPAAAVAQPSAAAPPNIILTVVDDLGWGDLSLKGAPARTAGGHAEFSTPHIDALAKDGVVLDQYYVNQLCSPTRTSLMSGRYAYNIGLAFGVITNGHPVQLGLNESTVAEGLSALGYQTLAVGKWDIGYTAPANTPCGRGFDRFVGYYNADEDYFKHTCGGKGCKPASGLDLHNDTKGASPGAPNLVALQDTTTYSTFIYTAAATDFIEARDPARPFFIYLAYQAVHGPLEAPQRFLDMCTEEVPGYRLGAYDRSIFCGMVKALDEGIGNVTRTLAAEGLDGNTLFCLTTDNGGQNKVGGNNWPLRGNKATVYEGGVRGTGFMWGAPLGGAKGLWQGLMHNIDWLPTLISAAGGPAPPAAAKKDGIDMWSAVRSMGDSPRTEVLLQLAGPQANENAYWIESAIRVGRWKLVTGMREAPVENTTNVTNPQPLARATGWVHVDAARAERSYLKPTAAQSCEGETRCLFDLQADPLEKENVAARNPDVVAQLWAALQKYNASQIPNQVGAFDLASCPSNFNGAWMPWRANNSYPTPPPRPAPPPGAQVQGSFGGVSVGQKCSAAGWCSGPGFSGPTLSARVLVDGREGAAGDANVSRAKAGPHGFVLALPCAAVATGKHTAAAQCSAVAGDWVPIGAPECLADGKKVAC